MFTLSVAWCPFRIMLVKQYLLHEHFCPNDIQVLYAALIWRLNLHSSFSGWCFDLTEWHASQASLSSDPCFRAGWSSQSSWIEHSFTSDQRVAFKQVKVWFPPGFCSFRFFNTHIHLLSSVSDFVSTLKTWLYSSINGPVCVNCRFLLTNTWFRLRLSSMLEMCLMELRFHYRMHAIPD